MIKTVINFHFFFQNYKIKIKGDENANLINSEVFSGRNIKEAIPLIKSELTRRNFGKDSKVLHIKVKKHFFFI